MAMTHGNMKKEKINIESMCVDVELESLL